MNLLHETLEFLKANDKSPSDVRWVAVLKKKYWPSQKMDPVPYGSWKDFAEFADFEYYEGYGGAEVNTDLFVVGKNWWLERGEYDGSEWWEFKTQPKKPEKFTPLRATDVKKTW